MPEYGKGWHPSLPDARDERANPRELVIRDRVDPRDVMAPAYDQSKLGSCTANTIAAALQYHWGVDWIPSRLFIYWFERKYEHSLGEGDTGAYGRDGFKVARKRGVPPESEWPYEIDRYDDKPPDEAIAVAENYVLEDHYKSVVQNKNHMQAILSHGQTIAFGFTVYESFESDEVARTGQVPMPNPQHERQLGGHEVLLVGYDTETDLALVRNSWGTDWGEDGYCWMPWQIILSPDYSDDHRTIHRSRGR